MWIKLRSIDDKSSSQIRSMEIRVLGEFEGTRRSGYSSRENGSGRVFKARIVC